MKLTSKLLAIILPIAAGLLIGLGIRQYFASASLIKGPSMEPNLQNSEVVGVFKTLPIHRNTVIIFNAHGEDPDATKKVDYYVKRVIGLPGDTVTSNNGQIYINNKVLNQGYISQRERVIGTGNWDLLSLSSHWRRFKHAMRVPQNEYFVLGDHRSVSNDSRYWGFVDKDKVLGVVKTAPFNKDSKEINSASATLE